MLNGIRLRFEGTPEVHALRTKQGYLERKGDYKGAMMIGEKIEDLFVIALDKYMSIAEKEVCVLDSETSDMPEKDKEEMMVKLMVLFMACDIIDSAIVDLNDVLHRTKPDIDITAFSDIQMTADMARKKLKYLQENGDYMEDLVWADKCDDMYEMIQSKARSIIRKRRDDKDWGKNMERFLK